MRKTLEVLPALVLAADPQGEITLLSRDFRELTGLGPEAGWETLFPMPAEREQLRQGQDVRTVVPTPGGARRVIAWTCRPGPLPGLDCRFVATGSDVTEAEHRSHAESTLRREALILLAGGVAHELNNGLAPLLGHTELLLQDLGQEDARAEQLLEMHEAALKLRQLADRILLLGENRDLAFRPTTLNAIVSDSLLWVEECLTEEVTVKLELDPEPWTCPLDATSIAQALRCLVLNAVQAMPDGGEIDLITRKVYVEEGTHPELGPGEYAVLECVDGGFGMDEATRKRAFEPFFTTREFGEGAGTGLSLVHAVARRHHGHAVLETRPGKGTRVTLYFPRTQRIKPDLPVPSGRRPSAAPASILLVEDDQAVLRLVQRLLEREGYQVVSATHGAEALELAAGMEPVDLLLTDVVMPGMRGPQLYRRLLARWPDLRVVYMSGYAPDDITEGDRFDYLRKPFTARELKDYLERALSS